MVIGQFFEKGIIVVNSFVRTSMRALLISLFCLNINAGIYDHINRLITKMNLFVFNVLLKPKLAEEKIQKMGIDAQTQAGIPPERQTKIYIDNCYGHVGQTAFSTIYVSPFFSTALPPVRQRFTLAHESVHLTQSVPPINPSITALATLIAGILMEALPGPMQFTGASAITALYLAKAHIAYWTAAHKQDEHQADIEGLRALDCEVCILQAALSHPLKHHAQDLLADGYIAYEDAITIAHEYRNHRCPLHTTISMQKIFQKQPEETCWESTDSCARDRLHEAVSDDNFEMAQFFIDHGTDANVELHSATWLGNLPMVKLLIDHCTTIGFDMSLERAAGTNNLDITKILAHRCTPEGLDQALAVAQHTQHADIVAYLQLIIDTKKHILK